MGKRSSTFGTVIRLLVAGAALLALAACGDGQSGAAADRPVKGGLPGAGVQATGRPIVVSSGSGAVAPVIVGDGRRLAAPTPRASLGDAVQSDAAARAPDGGRPDDVAGARLITSQPTGGAGARLIASQPTGGAGATPIAQPGASIRQTPASRQTPAARPTPGAAGSGTPGVARRPAVSPAPKETVVPTPTLRPAHPPPRGPIIIPRPVLPLTRDHTADARGFYRSDSVTPVPPRSPLSLAVSSGEEIGTAPPEDRGDAQPAGGSP